MKSRAGETHEQLSQELVFGQSGHLTDAGVAALADAQPILPDAAYAHLASCDACAARVAASALAGASLGAALAGVPASAELPAAAARERPVARPAAKRPRGARPMPLLALAAALVVAAAGVAPHLFDAPRWVPHAALAAVRLSPLVARAVVSAAVAANSSQAVVAFVLASAVAALALFVLFRLAAKTAPAGAVVKEGMSHES